MGCIQFLSRESWCFGWIIVTSASNVNGLNIAVQINVALIIIVLFYQNQTNFQTQ